VCALSGTRAGDACPIRRRERLAADAPQLAAGTRACTWHRAIDGQVATLWPDRYRSWAQANGLATPAERRVEMRLARLDDARPVRAGAAGLRASAPTSLHVAHPAEGTVFLIDPTLRAEFQALPFRAAGAGGGEVSWTVDGRPIGSASADGSVLWPLERGRHVAVVRDARGRTAEVAFLVK
jgi:membrane carboxypeptidase/penicillin-binding protein PbpC